MSREQTVQELRKVQAQLHQLRTAKRPLSDAKANRLEVLTDLEQELYDEIDPDYFEALEALL